MVYSGYEIDVELLRTGMILHKLKQGMKQRYYHLDLEGHQLVASTKESNKETKNYSLARLDEAQCGCKTEALKKYSAKCSVYEDVENRAFVLYFDKYKESLDLIAPNQVERDRWVRLLNHLINEAHPHSHIKTENASQFHFKNVDRNNDRALNKNEIASYLESLNFKINKKELNNLIKRNDQNKDGVLDEDEFQDFFNEILGRTDLRRIFDNIAQSNNYLTIEEFHYFLKNEQKENKSAKECEDLIFHYEPTSLKNEFKLSYIGFDIYMNDITQHLMNPKHSKVYQSMHLPLTDYYINSSHNTYLSGNQVKSESKVECYIAALMKGCRVLEIDCQDGPNGDPMVFHNYTLTTKIRFEDVVIGIKEYAFKASEFPVILSIENHCCPQQDAMLTFYITRHLRDFLFTDPIDSFESKMPPLESLRRKIFIRSSRKNTLWDCTKVPEYVKDLVNLFQTTPFRSIEKSITMNKAYEGSSIEEKDAENLSKSEPINTMKLSNNTLIKIFPAGIRQDSSNLYPVNFWNFGFQIVALNFQTKDKATILNTALFNDNGNCGYVLKPVILREPSLGFNPLDVNTMNNKTELIIEIITAQHLPRKSRSSNDIPDPYVVVSIHGVPADDQQEYKTKIVDNNGYKPVWNETCRFRINCPELAFVKFSVKDDDVGQDESLGDYAIRVQNMREGYRHIKLRNKAKKGTLFLKVNFNPIYS